MQEKAIEKNQQIHSFLTKEWTEANIPKLGFGAMRFPTCNDEIDLEQVKAMVDVYMKETKPKKGYFDTAFMYHGGKSEGALKEALVERYDRDTYFLADKLPIWNANEKEDMQKIFDQQLERTGAGYFDFYLLHAINAEHHKKIEQMGGYAFLQTLKEKKLARHIGFSFHGDMATLEDILRKHPEMEFVQLQINYLDWDNIGAKDFYNLCRKFNKPIIIMEPVKGGTLAKLPVEAQKIFKQNSEQTPASFAIRYVLGLEGVMTVLSGMSNMAQMQENLALTNGYKPLTAEESKLIESVVECLNNLQIVPCTACQYCKDCPKNIPISEIFEHYNKYSEKKHFGDFLGKYKKLDENSRANACIACGLCESVCPQNIPIVSLLKNIDALASQ